MPAAVCEVPTGERTYSCGVAALAVAATATDVFTITGNVETVTRVKRLRIGGIATGAGPLIVNIIRRTGPDTVLTATNPAPVLRAGAGSTEPANSVAAAHTANPGGLGATAAPNGGTLLVVTVPLGTAAAPVPDTVIDFQAMGMEPVELYSANDVLAVNQGGVTPAGEALQVSAEWCER